MFGKKKSKKPFFKKWWVWLLAVFFVIGMFGEVEETESPQDSSSDTVISDTSNTEESATVTDNSAEGNYTQEEKPEANTSEAPILPPENPSLPESTPQPKADSTFKLHFIDVGQADATLIECDGDYMLIDGGNKSDSNKIYSVLKKENVDKLAIVVGTHAHEDHIGGLPGAFNYATADLTLGPVINYDSDAFRDFAKYANDKGGGITVPSVGDYFTLGSASISILGINGGEDTNDTSIVLKVTYGNTSFLFTGDAERPAEQAILNSGADLSATVLKVGHHGSDTSTTYPFLREVMPQYAVISVGDGNSYGHPTDDALSRLRDADVTVYRTDLQGDIYCTSDGQTVTFSVERNSNADTYVPGTSPAPAPVTPDPAPVVTPAPTPSQDTDTSNDEQDEPVGKEYILNTNTHKFHYPSCSSVKKMSEKNKEYFTGTREEVIARGYDSCGNCHP